MIRLESNKLKNIHYHIISWKNNLSAKTNNIIEGLKISPSSSFYSSYNNLTGNTVNHNTENGIELERDDHNTVSWNNVNYNGEDGIEIDASSENSITDNIVNNNGRYGIYLHYFANDNNVTRNTVIGNQKCIVDEYDNNIWDNDCGIQDGSSSGGDGGGTSSTSDSGSDNTIPFGTYYLWIMIVMGIVLVILTSRRIQIKKV